MRVFQTILYKKVNGKLTAAIMPLHTTQPQKKYKSGLGYGGGGLYIPQRPKQVNLSTEVVKGVVPKWVSKWYMVRVVPKVVPKCGIEGGIEIRIPIIFHI